MVPILKAQEIRNGWFCFFPFWFCSSFSFTGKALALWRRWLSDRRAACPRPLLPGEAVFGVPPPPYLLPEGLLLLDLKNGLCCVFLVPSIPAAILVDFSICQEMTACRFPKAWKKHLQLKDMGGGSTITTLALGHTLQGDLLPESSSVGTRGLRAQRC